MKNRNNAVQKQQMKLDVEEISNELLRGKYPTPSLCCFLLLYSCFRSQHYWECFFPAIFSMLDLRNHNRAVHSLLGTK